MSWLEDITSSIKYIEGNLTDELTLEKIAATVNLSPFYFQKGFSILCGITVSEVQKCLKMKKGLMNVRNFGQIILRREKASIYAVCMESVQMMMHRTVSLNI